MKVILSLCLAGCLAVAGCGLFSDKKPADQADDVWSRRVYDEDSAYLVRLNERVQEGKLTPADRDYLWQAYLARIQGALPPARPQQTRRREDDFWLWPFVLPAF